MKSGLSFKPKNWKSVEQVLFCGLALLVLFICFHLPEVDLRQMLFPDGTHDSPMILKNVVEFPDAYSQQFNSAYRFRDNFIRAYNRFKILVLKESVFPNVVIGKDRWLFWTGENNSNDFQNVQPLSEADLAKIQNNLDIVNQRLSEQGIVFRVVVAPNKATIYPDKMPAFMPRIGEKSRLDQVLTYLQQNGGPNIIVDLRPALLDARQSYPVYHAYDTHWNQDGALIASNEILRSLQPEFPNLIIHPRSDFNNITKSSDFDLPRRISAEDLFVENISILRPNFERKTKNISVGDDPNQTLLTQDNPDLPKLVLIRDSFGNTLIPFLSDSSQRSLYVKSLTLDYDLIAREKPDVVIFEMAERYLGNRLLNSIAP